MSTLTPSIRRAGIVAAVCIALFGACTSEHYSTSAAANTVSGTMTVNVADYGPWIGSRVVSASFANGSLTVIGEDVNYKKITLFLIGVTPTTIGLPLEVTLSQVVSDSIGYVEMRERYQVGTYIYNTFNGGHATIILTTLSADRVVGTFSFLAERPVNSTIIPTFRAGSSGAFDIKPTTQ